MDTQCDVCHQRTATGRNIRSIEGKEVTTNYCDECHSKVPLGDTDWATATAQPHSRRSYWFRIAAAAVFAVFVSIGVSAVGRSRLWPHAESIAFAVFVFLIPILQSIADRRRVRNWPLLFAVAAVFGAIGGFVHAIFIER